MDEYDQKRQSRAKRHGMDDGTSRAARRKLRAERDHSPDSGFHRDGDDELMHSGRNARKSQGHTGHSSRSTQLHADNLAVHGGTHTRPRRAADGAHGSLRKSDRARRASRAYATRTPGAAVHTDPHMRPSRHKAPASRGGTVERSARRRTQRETTSRKTRRPTSQHSTRDSVGSDEGSYTRTSMNARTRPSAHLVETTEASSLPQGTSTRSMRPSKNQIEGAAPLLTSQKTDDPRLTQNRAQGDSLHSQRRTTARVRRSSKSSRESAGSSPTKTQRSSQNSSEGKGAPSRERSANTRIRRSTKNPPHTDTVSRKKRSGTGHARPSTRNPIEGESAPNREQTASTRIRRSTKNPPDNDTVLRQKRSRTDHQRRSRNPLEEAGLSPKTWDATNRRSGNDLVKGESVLWREPTSKTHARRSAKKSADSDAVPKKKRTSTGRTRRSTRNPTEGEGALSRERTSRTRARRSTKNPRDSDPVLRKKRSRTDHTQGSTRSPGEEVGPSPKSRDAKNQRSRKLPLDGEGVPRKTGTTTARTRRSKKNPVEESGASEKKRDAKSSRSRKPSLEGDKVFHKRRSCAHARRSRRRSVESHELLNREQTSALRARPSTADHAGNHTMSPTGRREQEEGEIGAHGLRYCIKSLKSDHSVHTAESQADRIIREHYDLMRRDPSFSIDGVDERDALTDEYNTYNTSTNKRSSSTPKSVSSTSQRNKNCKKPILGNESKRAKNKRVTTSREKQISPERNEITDDEKRSRPTKSQSATNKNWGPAYESIIALADDTRPAICYEKHAADSESQIACKESERAFHEKGSPFSDSHTEDSKNDIEEDRSNISLRKNRSPHDEKQNAYDGNQKVSDENQSEDSKSELVSKFSDVLSDESKPASSENYAAFNESAIAKDESDGTLSKKQKPCNKKPKAPTNCPTVSDESQSEDSKSELASNFNDASSDESEAASHENHAAYNESAIAPDESDDAPSEKQTLRDKKPKAPTKNQAATNENQSEGSKSELASNFNDASSDESEAASNENHAAYNESAIASDESDDAPSEKQTLRDKKPKAPTKNQAETNENQSEDSNCELASNKSEAVSDESESASSENVTADNRSEDVSYDTSESQTAEDESKGMPSERPESAIERCCGEDKCETINVLFTSSLHSFFATKARTNIVFSPAGAFAAATALACGSSGASRVQFPSAICFANRVDCSCLDVGHMDGQTMEARPIDASHVQILSHKHFGHEGKDVGELKKAQNGRDSGWIQGQYKGAVASACQVLESAEEMQVVNTAHVHITLSTVTAISEGEFELDNEVGDDKSSRKSKNIASIIRKKFDRRVTWTKARAQVDMMHIQGRFHVAFLEELRSTVLILPYGKQLGMLYLLPRTGTKIAVVEEALISNGAVIRDWIRACSQKTLNEAVAVALPQFTIESEHDLIPSFERMGIRDVFNSSTGICRGAKTRYCSRARQKVLIQVNAGGLVSHLRKPKESKAKHLTFDRSFLFFFLDLNSGVTLFVGRVSNPTKTAI